MFILQYASTEESGSPFVFICENPHELLVKFPIKGKHKICEYLKFFRDYLFSFMCLYVASMNRDQTVCLLWRCMHLHGGNHIYIDVSSEIFIFKDFGCVYMAKTDIIS